MRLVPVVALVPEATVRRIDEITRAREQHVDDSEAMATLKALAAQNDWTMQMLVAGRYLALSVPDGEPEAQS